jgi:lipopolysaccharide transport system ATP-binding protein
MPKAVVVENLSKRFLLGETFAGTLRERLARALTRSAAHPTQEEFWALRDVGFEVEQGEAIGIIGGNGAGKSTLLKILSRITPPTKGRAMVRGRLSSLLEVGTGFHPELTGRENVYLNGAILGMRKQEIARKFDEIVDFSGVSKFIDTPVKRYSSGMYVRLAFAVAAHLEPDVLIIDEVLAVGDAEFQTKCLGKMQQASRSGRTVVFVSHNMGSISELCTSAVLLKNATVHTIGSVDDCIQQYLQTQSRPDLAVAVLPQEDPRFWLQRVRLLDNQARETNHFGIDSPITFEFEYLLAEPVKELELGFRVSTSRAIPVFTSTKPLPQDQLGVLRTARVTIPGHFLTPGAFLLTAAAHIPGRQVLCHWEGLLSFHVEETGSELARHSGVQYGVVFAPCEWDLPLG